MDQNTVDNYRKAFEHAGGTAAVEQHAPMSQKWQQLVDLRRGQLDVRQAPQWQGYHITEMPTTLGSSAAAQVGVQELQRMEAELKKSVDDGILLSIASTKGLERAAMKTKIKYLDDNARLCDINRGTLACTSIDHMYKALNHICSSWGPSPNVIRNRVLELMDCYQFPMDGGYRHVQLLLDLCGVVWELQLNTLPMLSAKSEGGGHKVYATARFLQEMILFCAIDSDVETLNKLLAYPGAESFALVDLKKDLNGLGALGHASYRGCTPMVERLLSLGANPFGTDKQGHSPLFWALSMLHWDVVQLLATAMLGQILEDGNLGASQKAALADALRLYFDIQAYVPTKATELLTKVYDAADRPALTTGGALYTCVSCAAPVGLVSDCIPGSWIGDGPAVYMRKMHGVTVTVGAWGLLKLGGKNFPNAIRWDKAECASCNARLGSVKGEVNRELVPLEYVKEATERVGCYLINKDRLKKQIELEPAKGEASEQLCCTTCGTYVASLADSIPGNFVQGDRGPAFYLKHVVNVQLGDGLWGSINVGGETFQSACLWKVITCAMCDTALGIQKNQLKKEVPDGGRSNLGCFLMAKAGFKGHG